MPVATPHLLKASDPQWPHAGALANSASIRATTSPPEPRDDSAAIRALRCTGVSDPRSANNALKSLAFMISPAIRVRRRSCAYIESEQSQWPSFEVTSPVELSTP